MGMRLKNLEKSDKRKNNRSFHMKREKNRSFHEKHPVFGENEKLASESVTLRCFRLNNQLPQALLVFLTVWCWGICIVVFRRGFWMVVVIV